MATTLSQPELAEIVALGRKAEHLMNDEVFSECIEWVRDDLHKVWSKSEPDGAELRENAYFQLQGLRLVLEKLQKLIGRGKQASVELENLKTQNRDGRGSTDRPGVV